MSSRGALLRTGDMAVLLGISKRTLMRWCAVRDVPHYKVGGALLFDADEVFDFVREHRREPEGVKR